MRLLDTADLTQWLLRIVSHLGEQQSLDDRIILAIGHAWKGLLSEDEFRKLVEEKETNRQALEALAAELAADVLEAAVEQQ